MPYYIRKGAKGCAGWATVKSDGSVLTCHPTKEKAIAQMVAISISQDLNPGGDWAHRNKKKESILQQMIAEAQSEEN